MTDFMDNVQLNDYLQYALALVFVLALIGLLAALAKRLGMGGATPRRRGRDRRLSVTEALALDGKRKLMLVRRDGVEHLIIVGPNSETVVEAGITTAGADFASAARSAAGRDLQDRTGPRTPSPADRIGLQRPRPAAGRDSETPE
ncbi:MAG: flagellar biosynthetic protein FliO [Rhodospirillales bacterium]|nr:flagellar biosynthetic protein FliO [Rhodospirillales bacterium]